MSSDQSFVSWFLGSSNEAPALTAIPSSSSSASTIAASPARGAAGSSSSQALAPGSGGQHHNKSSSELMLEDAVRWVLWQFSLNALQIDQDSLPYLTFEKLTLGSKQWLIQFVAGRRLSQSAATQLWSKHDFAYRGFIDSPIRTVTLRSLMNDVMHSVYNRRMVTEEMFQLVFHLLNVQRNSQILREHFMTLFVDHLLPFRPPPASLSTAQILDSCQKLRQQQYPSQPQQPSSSSSSPPSSSSSSLPEQTLAQLQAHSAHSSALQPPHTTQPASAASAASANAATDSQSSSSSASSIDPQSAHSGSSSSSSDSPTDYTSSSPGVFVPPHLSESISMPVLPLSALSSVSADADSSRSPHSPAMKVPYHLQKSFSATGNTFLFSVPTASSLSSASSKSSSASSSIVSSSRQTEVKSADNISSVPTPSILPTPSTPSRSSASLPSHMPASASALVTPAKPIASSSSTSLSALLPASLRKASAIVSPSSRPPMSFDAMVKLMASLRVAGVLLPKLQRRHTLKAALFVWRKFAQQAREEEVNMNASVAAAIDEKQIQHATDVLVSYLHEQSQETRRRAIMRWSGLVQLSQFGLSVVDEPNVSASQSMRLEDNNSISLTASRLSSTSQHDMTGFPILDEPNQLLVSSLGLGVSLHDDQGVQVAALSPLSSSALANASAFSPASSSFDNRSSASALHYSDLKDDDDSSIGSNDSYVDADDDDASAHPVMNHSLANTSISAYFPSSSASVGESSPSPRKTLHHSLSSKKTRMPFTLSGISDDQSHVQNDDGDESFDDSSSTTSLMSDISDEAPKRKNQTGIKLALDKLPTAEELAQAEAEALQQQASDEQQQVQAPPQYDENEQFDQNQLQNSDQFQSADQGFDAEQIEDGQYFDNEGHDFVDGMDASAEVRLLRLDLEQKETEVHMLRAEMSRLEAGQAETRHVLVQSFEAQILELQQSNQDLKYQLRELEDKHRESVVALAEVMIQPKPLLSPHSSGSSSSLLASQLSPTSTQAHVQVTDQLVDELTAQLEKALNKAETASAESIELHAQIADLQASRLQLELERDRLQADRQLDKETQSALESRWRQQRSDFERLLADLDGERRADAERLSALESKAKQQRSEFEALLADKEAQLAAASDMHATQEQLWRQQRSELEAAIDVARSEARTEVERLQQSHAELLFQLATSATASSSSSSTSAPTSPILGVRSPPRFSKSPSQVVSPTQQISSPAEFTASNDLILAQQRLDLANLSAESAKREIDRLQNELRQTREELHHTQGQLQSQQSQNQLLQQQVQHHLSQTQQLKSDSQAEIEAHSFHVKQLQSELTELQLQLSQSQSQSDDVLTSALAESQSLRVEVDSLHQRLMQAHEHSKQVARAHESQTRTLSETRAALLNQTDLCQNLAHQVQLQRDKMANLVMELQQQPLSNSSTLEQESLLKMLQDSVNELQTSLRTMRHAWGAQRLHVFVQRTSLRFQLSALFRWRQMCFLKNIASEVDRFLDESRAEKENLIHVAKEQIEQLGLQRDEARAQALDMACSHLIVPTVEKHWLRSAFQQWHSATKSLGASKSTGKKSMRPPTEDEIRQAALVAGISAGAAALNLPSIMPILSHSIAVLSSLLQHLQRHSVPSPTSSSATAPTASTQQLALQHTIAALNQLQSQFQHCINNGKKQPARSRSTGHLRHSQHNNSSSTSSTSTSTPVASEHHTGPIRAWSDARNHIDDEELEQIPSGLRSSSSTASLHSIRSAASDAFKQVANDVAAKAAFAPGSPKRNAAQRKFFSSTATSGAEVSISLQPTLSTSSSFNNLASSMSASSLSNSASGSDNNFMGIRIDPEQALRDPRQEIRRVTNAAMAMLSPPQFLHKSTHQSIHMPTRQQAKAIQHAAAIAAEAAANEHNAFPTVMPQAVAGVDRHPLVMKPSTPLIGGFSRLGKSASSASMPTHSQMNQPKSSDLSAQPSAVNSPLNENKPLDSINSEALRSVLPPELLDSRSLAQLHILISAAQHLQQKQDLLPAASSSVSSSSFNNSSSEPLGRSRISHRLDFDLESTASKSKVNNSAESGPSKRVPTKISNTSLSASVNRSGSHAVSSVSSRSVPPPPVYESASNSNSRSNSAQKLSTVSANTTARSNPGLSAVSRSRSSSSRGSHTTLSASTSAKFKPSASDANSKLRNDYDDYFQMRSSELAPGVLGSAVPFEIRPVTASSTSSSSSFTPSASSAFSRGGINRSHLASSELNNLADIISSLRASPTGSSTSVSSTFSHPSQNLDIKSPSIASQLLDTVSKELDEIERIASPVTNPTNSHQLRQPATISSNTSVSVSPFCNQHFSTSPSPTGFIPALTSSFLPQNQNQHIRSHEFSVNTSLPTLSASSSSASNLLSPHSVDEYRRTLALLPEPDRSLFVAPQHFAQFQVDHSVSNS